MECNTSLLTKIGLYWNIQIEQMLIDPILLSVVKIAMLLTFSVIRLPYYTLQHLNETPCNTSLARGAFWLVQNGILFIYSYEKVATLCKASVRNNVERGIAGLSDTCHLANYRKFSNSTFRWPYQHLRYAMQCTFLYKDNYLKKKKRLQRLIFATSWLPVIRTTIKISAYRLFTLIGRFQYFYA